MLYLGRAGKGPGRGGGGYALDSSRRSGPRPTREREFFIDNLLVRIHFIIVMTRWTGLAPAREIGILLPNNQRRPCALCYLLYPATATLQGYLAHKKTPTPLGMHMGGLPSGLGGMGGGMPMPHGLPKPLT